MELLRFFTAGNVDDGKSTLIGRLLFDSKSISTDIIETLTRQSKVNTEDSGIDLALLTDGLRAERELGITIDVAYKYFSTDKRKFIIADTPGHTQYTRNMFTGASNADLAIILVDARNGVTEQTKRHSIISSLLAVPHVVVCINKMDLVNYSEQVFEDIKNDYLDFAGKLGIKEITFIPVSAYVGDNVVKASVNMPWYKGATLISHLEDIPVLEEKAEQDARFQVQYVIRPQTKELHDYRGFAGKIFTGHLKKGQAVKLLPSGLTSTIIEIETGGKDVEEAFAPQSIIIHLQDDVDLSRGDSIVPAEDKISSEKEIHATICWMDNAPYRQGQKLLIQQNSFRTKAAIKEILSNIDIHTYQASENDGSLKLNDISKVQLKTANPISFDPYAQNRYTGSFILIDENTNNTVAAGMIS
jgi:sulfate adenylyltransferase subunit 1